jgi:hypothetical protein
MVEKNQKIYDKFLRDARPVLLRFYGWARAEKIIRDTEPIYERFLAETPYIGGKCNLLSQNIDIALPIFALYEASGRTLTEAMANEIFDIIFDRYRSVGKWVDLNRLDRPWLTRLFHGLAAKMAVKINANKGGAWNNTWGVQVNPEGHDHGLAFTLVGCPLADFAKSHGYEEIMPWLCNTDERTAALMHARLIRHHTVAQGYDTCDYWYVGDQDRSEQ